MANEGRELYEFGPFRLDPEKRLLLCNDEPVPLQLKAFETLLVLVRNNHQVVLKDEIMKAVWPDTFVEESNLAQNIFVLRKTLATNSADPQSQRYIVTVPGRGYRFAENVRVVSDQDALVVQRHSRTHVLMQEQIIQTPAANPMPVVQSDTPKASLLRQHRLAILISALPLFGFVIFLLRPALPAPRVTAIHQITHLGTLVHNTHLLTDGPRIYFRVWRNKNREHRSVSAEGGEVSEVQVPIPIMDIDDISPNGSEFLARDLGDQAPVAGSATTYASVWRVPVPTGSPRPVGLRSHEAAWSPDGRTLAYSLESGLFTSNLDGTHSSQIVALPDAPIYIRWSPDGKRLRFSAGDGKVNEYYLWEADLTTHTAQKVILDLPASTLPITGGWSPDGKYFFYTAKVDGVRNIYAIREKSTLLYRTSSSPVQLTNGPLTFYVPLPAKDGKRLFVTGEQVRGEVIRFDSAARQFVPFTPSISADFISYSHDGQWMAYIDFPEGALERSRIDGSERRQLTYPPMRALSPQWSPDDAQIAFAASSEPAGYTRIYLVPRDGGIPVLATSSSDDRQYYPSWTSDGASILFTTRDGSQSKSDMRLLDLRTHKVSTLAGTEGLVWGQISPDGSTVVAMRPPTHALTFYDIASRKTRELAVVADYPRWSRDGKSAYFNNIYYSAAGRTGGVCRWDASTGTITTLVKYPDFLLAGMYGVTFSLTPDGSILLLRDVSNRDLYALDLDLP